MDAHRNFAYTSVLVAPSPAASGISVTLAAGGGALMPAVPFNATVCPAGVIPLASNAEVVRVTLIAGDVLTIARAQEGSSARSILVGDQFFASITAKTLTDVESSFAGLNGAITGGSMTVNTSGISVSLPAYLTTAMASNRGSDFVQATAAFAGTSASGTIASNGISVSIGPYITTARRSTDAIGLSTAQTNVTWTANSSGLSLNAGGYAGTGFTSTTTTGTAVLGTNNTAGLSLGVPAFLTTAALSNHSHGNPQLNLTNLSGTTASNSAGFTLSLSAGTAAAAPVNFSAGTTSGNLGSVVFSNSNGVSFGLNGSTITGSVDPTSSVVGTSGITVSSNGNSASFYITASNVNGVSFGFSNGALTGSVAAQSVESQSVGMSTQTAGGATGGTTGYASGAQVRYLLVPGSNVTMSQSVNGASGTLSIYAGAVAAVTGISGVGASDTTYSSGTVIWSGQNNITIGSSVNGASQYVRLSVGPYITTARGSTDAIGLGTAKTNVTWTVNSNGLSFDAGGYAGTGFTSTTTAGTDIKATQNTAGLSMAVPAYLTAAAGGNNLTLQDAATTLQVTKAIFSNLNGVTFGLSTAASLATVTASVAAQTNQTLGLYATGNTTNNSSTTFDARTAGTWNALGAVTVGFSNGSVQLSAPATSSIVGMNGISISTAGSTISVMNVPLSALDPFSGGQPVSNSSLGQSTLYIAPFDVAEPLSASRINFFLSLTHTYSGAPANSTAWLALGYGLYTKMTGASSERLSLLTSYSLSYMSASASSSTRLSVTNYIGLSNATSHSTSQYGVQNASVSNYLGSSLAGFREIALPLGLVLNPGRYWLAFSNQSASQGASMVLAHSILQNQYSNNIAYRPFGAVSAASNASFYGASEGLGIYSAQTAAFPASIPLSSDSIRGAPVMTIPYFNISGWGTSTNLL